MKNEHYKDIKLYIIFLFISVIYFCGFSYIYFIRPLGVSGTHIDYGIVLIMYVLPLIFSYAIALYFSLTSNENKRNMLGWIMIIYTFIYLVGLILFLFSGTTAPSTTNVNEPHPYIVETVIFLLNLMAIWYIFEGLLFLEYRMKSHIYAVGLSILILVVILFMGVT